MKKLQQQLPAPLSPERELLLEQLRERSTEIFIEPLTRLLNNGPKAKDIEGWAKLNPGDWARALSVLGRLAGWSEKSEVVHKHRGVVGHIHAMSDAELIIEARNSLGSYAVLAGQPCVQNTGPELENVAHSDLEETELDSSTRSQQDLNE